ncbi:MAG: CoA transferase [Rhodospirillales bacterium]|nr:CoA transferase [Rhodospirillales bacterium]
MNRPLSGIRVTGLEQYMAGPYCTLLLADAGAEIIKIERPGKGDPRRSIPPFVGEGDSRQAAGFLGYNRNKKSLALDLRNPKGQEVYRKLVTASDVVVENLRPGSMDRQGLGYEDMRKLNPKLVWAIISGFGRMPGFQGPYSDRPAFDIVAEAMGGIMHQTGFADKPPSWTIYGMADIYTGMVTAFGILQALFARERSGEGQLVDSAMLDNMLALNEQALGVYSVSGQVAERGRLRNVWPRGAFQTKDGYIALNVPDNIIWSRLAEAMGRPDLIEDDRSKTAPARTEHAAILRPIIESWLGGMTRAEAVDALNAAGVPTGPVYSAEDIFADPHVEARGMLMDVGEQKFARTVPHLSSNPNPPAEPAPLMGQDTRPILEDLLGYSASEVDGLIAEKVVQAADE